MGGARDADPAVRALRGTGVFADVAVRRTPGTTLYQGFRYIRTWYNFPMRYEQVVRAKGAKKQHIQHVDEIKVPDMWHLYSQMLDAIEDPAGKPVLVDQAKAEQLLETWHLCHDLLNHLKRVCVEPRS